MIDNGVMLGQSAQNAKTVTNLGAAGASQSGKQSPTVNACRETFQYALRTATDKSMDANALSQNNQPNDNLAAAVIHGAAETSPVAELTTETGTPMVTAPDIPVVPEDFTERDETIVSNALIQLLLLALKPAADIDSEGIGEDIRVLLEGLSPEEKTELLKLFDDVVAQARQLTPSDAQKNESVFARLLEMLIPPDEAEALIEQLDPRNNIRYQAGITEVSPAVSGAAKSVAELLNQVIAALNEDAADLSAEKTVISIKTDGSKAEFPDMLMAFRARLAVIANELRAAVADAQPADDAVLSPRQISAPVLAVSENEGGGNGKGNPDAGRDAKTSEAPQGQPGTAMTVSQFKAHASALRANTPPPQVNAQNIIEQIVQSANLRSAPGNTQMEIQLKPEFLGKLSIILTSTDDGVAATIRAATAEVRNALSANIAQLQTTLRESGINMKDITISNSTLAGDFTRSESGARQDYGEDRESNARVSRLGRMLSRPAVIENADSGVGLYDSSQNLPVIASDMASVEFTA